jgi:hypothetical protein
MMAVDGVALQCGRTSRHQPRLRCGRQDIAVIRTRTTAVIPTTTRTMAATPITTRTMAQAMGTAMPVRPLLPCSNDWVDSATTMA